MLDAGAVDVLQADVTRCAGITELLRIGGCVARTIYLSPATADRRSTFIPACAIDELIHLEYFHDHVRIEEMLFDGLPELREGALWPDLSRPGNGLSMRRSDAVQYSV